MGEQGEPQGELRVTCSTAMGERFVAPIIRRFAMPHPKLNVTIDLTNGMRAKQFQRDVPRHFHGVACGSLY